MVYGYILTIMILAWSTLGASTARAQEGLIFAGGFYEALYAAVDMEHLPLQHAELTFQIQARHLAALVVPDAQPAGEFLIYKAERESTKLSKVTVTRADFERLRNFASDGIFVALEAVRANPQDRKSVSELQRKINDLPSAQRQNAERFAGARLADMDLPRNHDLSGYVQNYRVHIEERALSSLKNPKVANDLHDGVPHSFGTQLLTHGQLQAVQGKDIEIIKVGDREYQKAWVEGALVIIPRSKSSTSSGKGKLEVTPDASYEIKRGPKGNKPVKHVPSGHR
jgi:hypothetical protein